MILPSKHLLAKDSLIGVGGLIIDLVGEGKTVSQLWEQLRDRQEIGRYERFILALDSLYLIGLIELKDGLIRTVAP